MAGKNVIPVNDANFEAEVLRADGPVLVELGATWCGPCRALAPIVARIAEEQAGRLKVVAIDTDDAPAISARYGVRSVPTLLVFRGGAKLGQHVGLTTREKVLALVASAQA